MRNRAPALAPPPPGAGTAARPVMMLLVVLMVVTAGCSGGDGDSGGDLPTLETTAGTTTTSGSATGDAEQALISFARCMRENGFPSFPDPTLNADGTIGFGTLLAQLSDLGIDAQSDAFAAAVQACQEFLQGVALELIGEGFDQTELQDSLLAFARCMRGQGIAVDDPDLTALGEGEGILANVDLDDPEVQAALEICQREFAFPGLSGSSDNESGNE